MLAALGVEALPEPGGVPAAPGHALAFGGNDAAGGDGGRQWDAHRVAVHPAGGAQTPGFGRKNTCFKEQNGGVLAGNGAWGRTWGVSELKGVLIKKCAFLGKE